MTNRQVVSTFTRAFPRLIGVLCIWRSPGTSIVTANGMFDLDDVCSGSNKNSFSMRLCMKGYLIVFEPTPNHLESVYNKAIAVGGISIRQTDTQTGERRLTPANTLVISRTLIPFRGSVSSLAGIAEKRRLWGVHLGIVFDR